MKIAKKIAIALLVILVAMQFYRPDKNTASGDYITAFKADTKPDAQITQILENACYDCHSDHTEYPWYNNIAPVSYWIDHHIEEGKEHLDFSDWENYSLKKKDHKMDELIEEVEEGEMPLNEYTWTHGDARLTEEQKHLLMDWAKKVREGYQATGELE